MKVCELCGAEVDDSLPECPRCGFAFPRTVREDMRDVRLKERHGERPVEELKRDMRNRHSQLRAYLDNMDARHLTPEEIVSLADAALSFMDIPLTLDVEDELRLSPDEAELVLALEARLAALDSAGPGPAGTVQMYLKLANALQSMDMADAALECTGRALLLDPRCDDALYSRARLLFRKGDHAGARRCLAKLAAGGKHPRALYLAELLEQLSH